MKKTLPKEDFDLSSIDENFIFTAKVGFLHSYFELPFYKKWNYDFSEIPILNFLSKEDLFLMTNTDYVKKINYMKEEYEENEKKVRKLECFLKKLRENIKESLIKNKMYKNIANNFNHFNVNQLGDFFVKAPENELIYFVEKLKESALSDDYIMLLKSLIFNAINVKKYKCEEILKNLPALYMDTSEMNIFLDLCENKNMLCFYEYFKEKNNTIYNKMFERYTQKNISNF